MEGWRQIDANLRGNDNEAGDTKTMINSTAYQFLVGQSPR